MPRPPAVGEELIPLYVLRRKLGIRRLRLYRWWYLGVIDPRDWKKPPHLRRRVKLQTFMGPKGRSTTMALLEEFNRARDLAEVEEEREETRT